MRDMKWLLVGHFLLNLRDTLRTNARDAQSHTLEFEHQPGLDRICVAIYKAYLGLLEPAAVY